MKIKDTQDNFIPNPEYLAFQFLSFLHAVAPENRQFLANDRIKRFQKLINQNIKQGVNEINSYSLIQLTLYFHDFMQIGTSSEENIIRFFPNLLSSLNEDIPEPRLLIIKVLIDKKYLLPIFGMIFENKYLIGSDNRIYDGLPIFWNGDINSIVTLFCILYFLKEIEIDDAFDTKKHREYSQDEKEKKQQSKEKSMLRPNFTTLIGGKYIKSGTGKTGNGNFIINGEGSYKKWATINRRCKGIYSQLNDFFDELINGRDIKNVPKEKLLDFFIKNKCCISNNKEKDYRIDFQIIDLVCDCYSKTNTSTSQKKLYFHIRNNFTNY